VSFEQPGTVSLWLFRKPEDPADVGKDILKEFCGVDDYDLDHQEYIEQKSPTPVRPLIERLSYSASFLDHAVAAAKRRRISEALGVLAQFEFAYDPEQATGRVARDPIFLGCFQWHE
jgi:hypothetical protein